MSMFQHKNAALLLVTLALAGCGTAESISEKVRPAVRATEIVAGLQNTFSTTGEVTANTYSRITAEFRADVQGISSQSGDHVQTGQTLLILDADSVRARYRTASTSYATAAQNVAQTQLTMQKNIESAEVSLQSAQINLDTVLKQNEAKRIQAKETLNSSSLNLDLSVDSAKTKLENAMRDTASTIDAALTSIDKYLEVTDQYQDLNYIRETHVGVKDKTLKLNTQQKLRDNIRHLDSFTNTYNDSVSLMSETLVSLADTLRVMRNSVTSPDYTQVQLDTEINVLIGHQSSLNTTRTSLESAKSNLELTEARTQNTSQTLLSAQATYDATIADIDRAEQTARQQLREAEIAYEGAIESAKISGISARTALSGASGELEQARISDEKRTIQAPFTGYVVDIPVRVGDEVNPGDVLAIVENSETLKIETYLNLEEVRSISTGTLVDVEGYGYAQIKSISPSADPVSKKYKVEISYQNESLTPGQFIKLTFMSKPEDGDDRIFLPITSIHIKGSESFVWTLTGDGEYPVTKKVIVKIGSIFGEYVEIREGIAVSDVIVTEGGRNIDKEGTEVELSL